MGETHSDDLRALFDSEWYLERYPDVAGAGVDPLEHFLTYGAAENRDPNAYFDSGWYLAQNPDVAEAGLHPLVHYLQHGGRELRNPHPRFDAMFYVEEHPEAANNPMVFHVLIGAVQGWPTEKTVAIADYLPAAGLSPKCPAGVEVDVIIPVYRGLAQTKRCLVSVLADKDRPPGHIILVDDCSPEPELSAWLDEANATGQIRLIRHRRNMGFVVSANRGMKVSDHADVVLLNSDTVVPLGWLRRLAGHAYAGPRVGSVSPFSNNATICSYPVDAGGPMPFGCDLATIDATCQDVNGGRSLEVPTTVGFAMYIRRACLDEVGPFDAETFGRGYGEENDFCLRATQLGWRHLLACDTFVYHEGQVSFGVGSEDADGKFALLTERHPEFPGRVARHVRRDKVGPSRFALTAGLFARSGKPTLLFASHGLGGGVRQHVDGLVERLADHANVLLLCSTSRGIALSVPACPGHPELALADDRIDDVEAVLRSAQIVRAHVHHLLGMDFDLRGLLRRLDVPFDFTAHDYFPICPQINLLPQRNGQYCGEPGPEGCNACIAERPESGARDILSWRRTHAWLLQEADRVICPSEDARQRFARYGLDARGIVAPHEPIPGAAWPIQLPDRAKQRGRARPLRVAMLGVLANHKGAWRVESVAESASADEFEFHLIGYTEEPLSQRAGARVRETGKYQAPELPALIARVRPDVIWFSAQWPETYSYTLTAAIESGLPIVAPGIGSFPERLKDRPLAWIVDASAPAATWIETFRDVQRSLAARRTPHRPRTRIPVRDFYAEAYVEPLARPTLIGGPLDLRRRGRTTVLAVPERLGAGTLSPCAYIRLLLPLDHPMIGGGMEVVLADADEALRYRADIVICQRHSAPDIERVEQLVEHCRKTRARLVYDLDDDLLDIPPEHADFAMLAPRSLAVAAMVREANAVWVSTTSLRDKLATVRRDVRVMPNGLDERLWRAVPPPERAPFGPLRVLFMGTATHDADFALVLPALERLHAEHGDRVHVDVLGFTARDLPSWIGRVKLPATASASYPGFVNWMVNHNRWDAGAAPLLDTPFNRCKSPIKTIDYAALGLAVLASDVSVYRGSLADGAAGWLAPETTEGWFEAFSRLARDSRLVKRLREASRTAFLAHTLESQAEDRRCAWADVARMDVARPARRAVAA